MVCGRLKKWLGASIILHILPFLLIVLFRPDLAKQMLQEENKGGDTERSGQRDVQVIELVEAPSSETQAKKDLERFYWGIGVTVAYIPGDAVELPHIMLAERIEMVHSGYCAEAAGILPGDIIYLVNGDYIEPGNQLDGNGPAKLSLTILRNKRIVIIQLDRCKVYY